MLYVLDNNLQFSIIHEIMYVLYIYAKIKLFFSKYLNCFFYSKDYLFEYDYNIFTFSY